MKTTGVVRRIDDLGRIVIPKEIRRTLRIKDGESLEILVDNDTITLKKFSTLNDFITVSEVLCNSVSEVIRKHVLITNIDKVVAVSAGLREKGFNKNISKYMENLIINRQKVVYHNVSSEIFDGVFFDCSYLVYPIIVAGDVFGLVIILSFDNSIDNRDEQVASILKNFLEKNIEG